MIKHLICLLLLSPATSMAQNARIEGKDRKVDAPIRKVTVFFAGAQVEHTRQVTLPAGKQVVIFEKLTDHVDPNSIQLRSSENATILSVRTRKNYDEIAIAKQDVDAMNAKRRKLDVEERKLRDEYAVLLYDEQLLLKNNDFGSQQQSVKIAELKEASVFYHSKLTEIQTRKSQLEDEIEKVIRQINQIEQEINTRRSLPVKNYTEIEVEMDVTVAGKTDFSFSYITPNASWKPYYDMRSSGVGAPVLLEAKGLVTQDTGEDWNNVQLVLSTNDPYDNTQEAVLEPWYLDYYTPAPRKIVMSRQQTTYDWSGEMIHGEVIDATSGEPLAFAKIQMGGNQNAVFPTDAAGRFSFVVPRGESGYTVSYLGYNSTYVTIDAPFTKILLVPQQVKMDELKSQVSSGSTITTYGVVAPNASYNFSGNYQTMTRDADMSRRQRKEAEKNRELNVFADRLEYQQQNIATAEQKDLRMEFTINTPFTVPSDNADHRVAIATYTMNAGYEYHSVPKLDESVYLVAQISGWEKLNLLNGESNLYFDGTFIGKSYVDVNSAKDTLSFSLGKDRKIVVDRKRSEEKSKTRAIGNRTKYEVQWDFTVRNNGGASIPFIMKDHFPVPINDDIRVKQGEHPSVQLDEKTGILTWRTALAKGETKTFRFDYTVEYSTGQPIYLE